MADSPNMSWLVAVPAHQSGNQFAWTNLENWYLLLSGSKISATLALGDSNSRVAALADTVHVEGRVNVHSMLLFFIGLVSNHSQKHCVGRLLSCNHHEWRRS